MGVRLDRPKDDPWKLKIPTGTSAHTMHTDKKDRRKALVCTAGNTILHYDARCIDDLYAMLEKVGDWVELGGADEQKPAREGAVEGRGRSEANPSSRGVVRRAGGGAYGAPPASSVGLAEQEVGS